MLFPNITLLLFFNSMHVYSLCVCERVLKNKEIILIFAFHFPSLHFYTQYTINICPYHCIVLRYVILMPTYYSLVKSII